MISINSFVMKDHLIVEQSFLDMWVGKQVKFLLIEDYVATSEYRDGTFVEKQKFQATRRTPMEITVESITYDLVTEMFMINKQYKTRQFIPQ